MAKASADGIATELAALIERDRWQPGDRLPTEGELASRYGVSRPTMRKALIQCLAAGLLEVQQGKGWFRASDQRLRFPLDTVDASYLTARDDVWHAWVHSLGREAGHTLEVRIEEPPHQVVRLLGLQGESPLAVGRRRVRLIDGAPVMLSTSWWPLWLAANTDLAREGSGDAVDMRNPSPLLFCAQQGWPVLYEQNEVGARMPLPAEARLLRMSTSQPFISMHTTSWTREGRALRCTADLFPAHQFLLTAGRDCQPA